MNESNWMSGGCPFKGKRIDHKGNVKYKGQMIVLSHELQFILMKPKGKEGRIIEKELFPFTDIKSYGCHDNVLSVRLGGASVGMGESNMVYFKLKEAVVVKELMDQVIEMKKRPTPRMPSFDCATGFYDMSPTAGTQRGFAPEELQRKHSNTSMQENSSYFNLSQGQNLNDYSRAKLQRSVSSNSSCSSDSPLSGDMIAGHDNPMFQFSPLALGPPVQYAEVEMTDVTKGPESTDEPDSPHTPHPSGKKRFPFLKTKSAPKFGYVKVDIEVMKALQELESKE